MSINISKEIIENIRDVLKQVDVNGYESMERIVDVVRFFETILSQAEKKQKELDEKEKTSEEDGE